MTAPYEDFSLSRRKTPRSTSCSKSPRAGVLLLNHIVGDITTVCHSASTVPGIRVVQLLHLENFLLLANRFLNPLPALLFFPLRYKIPSYADVVELPIQLLSVCQTLCVQNSIINR